MMRRLLAACLLTLVAAPAAAGPGDLRSVTGMISHHRVLLVFAPSLRDPRLREQRAIFARFGAAAASRDLILVQAGDGKVIGSTDKENRLRRSFGTPPTRYRTLLIGKDGHVALDTDNVISEATLQRTIDAMPLRREEVRRIRAGLGAPKE